MRRMVNLVKSIIILSGGIASSVSGYNLVKSSAPKIETLLTTEPEIIRKRKLEYRINELDNEKSVSDTIREAIRYPQLLKEYEEVITEYDRLKSDESLNVMAGEYDSAKRKNLIGGFVLGMGTLISLIGALKTTNSIYHHCKWGGDPKDYNM